MSKGRIIYPLISFLIFFFLLTSTTYAADRYWVGGSASWDGTAGTKWSLTSGGAGGQAIPTSVDNCYFNAASGSTTVTIATGNTGCGNVDFTGFTGTVAGTGALTVSGSLTLSASSSRTYTGTLTFNATTSTSTITSNGKTLASNIIFNGVGGVFQLGDDLTTCSGCTISHTNGTLDANGKNISMGVFSSSGYNVRTINMGSGTWTITGNNGTVWNGSTMNNLTFVKGNPIIFSYSGSTGTRSIQNGLLNDISQNPDISITSGSDSVSLSPTFGSINFTGFSGTLLNPNVVNLSVRGSLTFSPNMSVATGTGKIILGNSSDLGWGRWNDGVLAPNGKIYGIPFSANKILIIDPVLGTATSSSMGLNITSETWLGGVLGDDGKIYGMPYGATSILIIDPVAGTAATSTMGASLSASNKYSGGVNAGNGKIYAIPSDVTSILVIDTVAGTATTTAMGANLTGSAKWTKGVKANNGKVYGIPASSANILIIDPQSGTATTSTMGASWSGTFSGGALGSNGKIYTTPSTASSILIIDPATDTATTSTMGANLSEPSKWSTGAAVASDGKIYSAPGTSNYILVIDPSTGTATTSLFRANILGRQKWRGLVAAANGNLYGIPYGSPDILVINPSSGVAYLSTMGAYSTPITSTLTTNGQILNFPLSIEGEGGTFNLADDLHMGSSSSLYIGSGTFNTNNHNITTGSINISGVDQRTINLGSSIITLTGTSTPVWGNTLTTNQTLNPQTSTVVLDGTNQSIQGSTTFYNLTKSSTTTDTLTFDANSTQTVTGTLTLQGQASSTLNLTSSIPGTKWNINPTNRSLSYLNVSDSNNTNSTPIPAYSMTGIIDSGNNTNWQFTAPTVTTPTTHTSSSGGSAQSRVNNLLAMGNTTLANQIAQQYNIAIPNTKTTPNTYTFTRSLQLGMTGNDVKQLQIFLNSKGYTVSYTGPGSPGNETSFFGIKTKLALIKYQKANNITPAIGYFGPVTRGRVGR